MEVLQAIISNAMSSFHLPESLIKEFESVFAEFLWSSPTRGRSTWWRGVECVRAKRDDWLDFKDLWSFNMTMLAKQGWRILSNPTSLLCHILIAMYFLRSDFLEANVGHNPSFTWRSIWTTIEVLKMGCCW
ncbi:UNVERIFIED_CONTAM: putative mitochondrial protein [Sesamum calycinum]|uniref:Mitochondrial protein n=1 Tax=Sesamum calycinum TaxID=2727403 RepID=A0AAW2IR41_9LAMI